MISRGCSMCVFVVLDCGETRLDSLPRERKFGQKEGMLREDMDGELII